MQDESLMNIVSGADAADDEDIFLRASLVVALSGLYAEPMDAAEPDAQEAVDDGECDGASAPAPAHQRAARSRLRHGWAFAASLVGVVMFGGAVMGGGAVVGGGKAPTERANLRDEVALHHEVYASEMTLLAEVPFAQADRQTAWLGERIERDLTVPDLADAGLRFVGGRMLVVNDRPVAELMYTSAGGHPIAVFVSQIGGKPWRMDVEQHGALHIASWAKDRYAYLVVGELDGAAVRDLAWRVKVQI